MYKNKFAMSHSPEGFVVHQYHAVSTSLRRM